MIIKIHSNLTLCENYCKNESKESVNKPTLLHLRKNTFLRPILLTIK